MTTRIKYKRVGNYYTSGCLINFEGKKFIVMIYPYKLESCFKLSILNLSGHVVEDKKFTTVIEAKRTARKLLINKYNINLTEEIRPRNLV